MMQYGTLKNEQSISSLSCCSPLLPSSLRVLDFMSFLMRRDNGHRGALWLCSFPGRGPFSSYASGTTLRDLSKMPVGLQLCGILAEPLPLLRSELGKDVVITIRHKG